MHVAERASWQNPKVLTTLLMVFVVGAFSGALSMRWGLHKRLHPDATSAPWKDPNAAKSFIDNCQRELNLTPKQSEEMAAILDDYKSYYQSVQDQLDDVRATGKSKILELLNEDQRKKFERMLPEVPR